MNFCHRNQRGAYILREREREIQQARPDRERCWQRLPQPRPDRLHQTVTNPPPDQHAWLHQMLQQVSRSLDVFSVSSSVTLAVFTQCLGVIKPLVSAEAGVSRGWRQQSPASRAELERRVLGRCFQCQQALASAGSSVVLPGAPQHDLCTYPQLELTSPE